MIRLKNIVKNNNIIKCDIYPEDSPFPGTVICNVRERNLVSHSLPNGYEWCKNHVFHALYALLEMNDKGNILSEKTIMWV